MTDDPDDAKPAATGKTRKVPGPSPKAATNLIIADVALRGLSSIARRSVEKGLLRAQYSKAEATDILNGQTIKHALASHMVAKMATRSIPGFLLVTGGLLGKALIDRGLARGEAEARSAKAPEKPAEKAED